MEHKKRLYRSRKDRMIAGVCGGLANYFEMDPAIIRIICAVLILCWGSGLILYIICAICIPEEPY